MVDTVKIDETQVAKWAQEDTLRKLLQESRISNDILQTLTDDKISKDTLAEIRKNANQGKTQSRETISNLLKLGDRTEINLSTAIGDFRQNFLGSIGSVAKSLATGSIPSLSSLASSAASGGKSLLQLSTVMPGALKAITALGGVTMLAVGALASMWPLVNKVSDNYMKLFETGVRFDTGLAGLANAAGQIGITGQELTGILTQFGAAVNYLGTNRAVALTKQFTKLNLEAGNLMMTNTQAAEAMLEYIDTMKNTGVLRDMTDEQLIKNSQTFYKELNELAEATGRNRKEIQKSIQDKTKDLNLNAALARLAPEVRERVLSGIKQFEKLGPAASKTFTDITTSYIARGGPAGLSKELINIISQSGLDPVLRDMTQRLEAGLPIGDQLNTITKVLNESDFAKQISMAAGMGGELGSTASALEELRQGIRALTGVQDAQRKNEQLRIEEAKEISKRRYGTEARYQEILQEQAAKRQEYENRALKVSETFSTISAKFGNLLDSLAVNILGPLLPVVNSFGTVISSAMDILIDFVDSVPKWLGTFYDNLVGAWTGISKWATDTIGDFSGFWEGLKSGFSITASFIGGMFTKLGSFIEPLLHPFDLLSKLVSTVADLFGSLVDKFGKIFGITSAVAAPATARTAEADKESRTNLQESLTKFESTHLDAVNELKGVSSKTADQFSALAAQSSADSQQFNAQQLDAIAKMASTMTGFNTTVPLMATRITETVQSKIEPTTPAMNQTEIARLLRERADVPAVTPVAALPGETEEVISNDLLNRRAMKFYDEATVINGRTVDILKELSDKISELNQNVKDQTSDLSRDIGSIGSVIH